MAISNISAIESFEDWDEKIEKSEEMLLGARARARSFAAILTHRATVAQ